MRGVRATLHNGTTLENAANYVSISEDSKLTYNARQGNKIWLLFETDSGKQRRVPTFLA